jgi:hypothetical protein
MEEQLLKTLASGLLAYSIHYGSMKAYNTFCIPEGYWGFIQGFLTTGSPVCQTILSISSQTQVSYSSFLLVGMSRFAVDMIPTFKEPV